MIIWKPALQHRWARNGNMVPLSLEDFRPCVEEMPERCPISNTVVHGTPKEDAIN
uniref:Uncharacterized protein n=1 Tax=Rhizophora mucronata TaxID=61149 RepID=A0A2P2IQN0_RHIMU